MESVWSNFFHTINLCKTHPRHCMFSVLLIFTAVKNSIVINYLAILPLLSLWVASSLGQAQQWYYTCFCLRIIMHISKYFSRLEVLKTFDLRTLFKPLNVIEKFKEVLFIWIISIECFFHLKINPSVIYMQSICNWFFPLFYCEGFK